MILPKMVNREYMPSSNSMAVQIVDVNNAVKQKYVRLTSQDSLSYPYKVLQMEKETKFELKGLLELYTKSDVKDIVSALKSDIKKT